MNKSADLNWNHTLFHNQIIFLQDKYRNQQKQFNTTVDGLKKRMRDQLETEKQLR